MTLFLGKDGVNREIKEVYLSVGGVNKEIKEIYGVDNGVNRKIYSNELYINSIPSPGTIQLSKYVNIISVDISSQGYTTKYASERPKPTPPDWEPPILHHHGETYLQIILNDTASIFLRNLFCYDATYDRNIGCCTINSSHIDNSLEGMPNIIAYTLDRYSGQSYTVNFDIQFDSINKRIIAKNKNFPSLARVLSYSSLGIPDVPIITRINVNNIGANGNIGINGSVQNLTIK